MNINGQNDSLLDFSRLLLTLFPTLHPCSGINMSAYSEDNRFGNQKYVEETRDATDQKSNEKFLLVQTLPLPLTASPSEPAERRDEPQIYSLHRLLDPPTIYQLGYVGHL